MKSRAALVALAGDRTTEDDTLGGRLLADVRRILELLQNPERVRSVDLVRELHAVEDGPWKRYGRSREPLEADDLARLVRPYGIRPRQLKLGAEKVRGYRTADFADAFERYGAGVEPEDEGDSLDLLSHLVPPGTTVPAAQDALFSVPPPPVPPTVPLAAPEARAFVRRRFDG